MVQQQPAGIARRLSRSVDRIEQRQETPFLISRNPRPVVRGIPHTTSVVSGQSVDHDMPCCVAARSATGRPTG